MGFIAADRNQMNLFGYSLDDFVRPEAKCRFVVGIVQGLDLSELYADYSPQGGDAYDPGTLLAACAGRQTRTYIPERKVGRRRRWAGKPAGWQEAVYGNRRRVRGDRGRELQRRRSEVLERSFAHVCETGGARRMWLRGLAKINKRYLVQVAAHNLGLLMRKVYGFGKPKALQGLTGALLRVLWFVRSLLEAILRPVRVTRANSPAPVLVRAGQLIRNHRLAMALQNTPSSTGC